MKLRHFLLPRSLKKQVDLFLYINPSRITLTSKISVVNLSMNLFYRTSRKYPFLFIKYFNPQICPAWVNKRLSLSQYIAKIYYGMLYVLSLESVERQCSPKFYSCFMLNSLFILVVSFWFFSYTPLPFLCTVVINL